MKSNRCIYVIYRQNDRLKQELFPFLRKIGLNPRDWQSATPLVQEASPLLSEVVAAGLQAAQAILVMHLASDEQDARYYRDGRKR
jgi:hypothetical protein